jgi:periplasmic divalent cation tolerance protein
MKKDKQVRRPHGSQQLPSNQLAKQTRPSLAERPSFIFIYVTCPNVKVARTLAEALVGKKMIACANILPQMHSIYFWDGAVQKDREVVLILKTRQQLFRKCEAEIKKNHPYKNPCIVALPIVTGSKDYLRWLSSHLNIDHS